MLLATTAYFEPYSLTVMYNAASAPKISRSLVAGKPWMSSAVVRPFCLKVSSMTPTGIT
ncbi:hypothetical protein D3C78_1452860 [compost metagenome]